MDILLYIEGRYFVQGDCVFIVTSSFNRCAPYIGSGIAACIGTAIIFRRWKQKMSERTPRYVLHFVHASTIRVHFLIPGVLASQSGCDYQCLVLAIVMVSMQL